MLVEAGATASTRPLVAWDLITEDDVVHILDNGAHKGVKRLNGKVLYQGVIIPRVKKTKVILWRDSSDNSGVIFTYLKPDAKVEILLEGGKRLHFTDSPSHIHSYEEKHEI